MARTSRRGKGEGAIYQRKDGRWTASITLEPKDGKRQRRSFYGTTRAEVARKLTAALRSQDDNLPIPGERETLGAHLDSWLKDSAAPALRPRTLASYTMICHRHLIPEIGKTPLAKLTPARVQAYMNAKRVSGLSARTVSYHHAILRRALGQAERWGKVARNVAKLVTPPRVERPEVRPLSPEQARVFVGAIAESRDAAPFMLALGLGLRQGELLGLTWADIDLESEALTIRHSLQHYGGQYHLDAPKTEKSRRTLGLPPTLVQVLRAHRAQQLQERLKAGAAWQGDSWNLVFATETGGPISGNHLTRRVQGLLATAGLPRQRFHDLRHAAATYMLAQGVDLRVVMEVLGHSQIHVTANTYAHVRIEGTRVAAERIEALLTQ